MAEFREIAGDLSKYTRKVQRRVYDNIVEATNKAVAKYDPRPSANSKAFWKKFKYKGMLGGAFAKDIRSGVYVKKQGNGYKIGVNINSAQMAILDSKGFTLRKNKQVKKGMLIHGVTKKQSFDFDKAERIVQEARDKTQSVIDNTPQ